MLILILFLPLTAWSHPGKTDRYGGHLCMKECEEWNLFYKEYHLHDKDGRPVRIKKEKKGKRAEPVLQSVPTESASPVNSLTTTVVTTHYRVATVIEENVYSTNPLLYVLAVLLLLLLVLRMNRRREEG